MENRRILKDTLFTIVLLASTFSFTGVLAYSAETTHPALTDEIVDLYNYHYSLKLSDEEKALVMQGSSDEDAPIIRVFNHFYDPVRNIGLFGVNLTAKTWAQNTRSQALFSRNVTAGVTESLYSARGEYSWERSVYEYVHGDKSRALLGLGHTLHMIEDMTVPPHTRNDQHLSIVDESPYEDWASKFTPENITVAEGLISERKSPITRNSIDEYMTNLAFFTNNNFFSKDTLPFLEAEESSIPEDRYPIPEYSLVGVGMLSGGEMQSFGVSKINGASYKLFELREKKSIASKEGVKKYRINKINEEESILSDYWNILSKEAVLNGAGVIKLFFDEVEKEKETLALYNKNKSWLSKFLPKILESQYTKGDVSPLQNVASVVTAFEQESFNRETPEVIQLKDSNKEVVPAVTEVEETEEAYLPEEILGDDNDAESQKEETSMLTELIPIKTPYIGFGGDGGASSVVQNTEEAEQVVVKPTAPTISSPVTNALLATTTITFSGTASSTTIISQDFSTATTTVGGSDAWELVLSGFAQGTTTVAFTATDSSNASSTATNISVFIDTVSPTIGGFAVLQCTHSLRSDSCLSGSTEVTLSWTSTSTDISYYEIVKDSSVVATTTASTSVATVSNKSSATLAVVAYDKTGNTATSSSQAVEVFENPFVINEVAWAGTQVSSTDEWIELYNRTSYTLDLSSIVLSASDGVPYAPLSGTVSSGGYYLIERTDDTPTNITANLITVFSGIGSGSGLSDSGEVLSLIHSLGGTASTTLDATPALSSCSGSWCGGVASTSPISMERISPDVLGTTALNWGSNNTYTKNGTDSSGGSINGTPKSKNSINLFDIGYYCPSESSTYTSGGYYIPSSSTCTYLSSSLSGPRYGDIYRGTIASSTIINGHSLGSSAESTQPNDTISNPIQGEAIFIAVYQVSSGADITSFRNYFKDGSSAPPHLNYGILEWKYGVAP
ncbi:MAG: hypothetical protein WD509_00565 [Candidatus Paceibacterota bacterium]